MVPERILVIEDDPDVRETVCGALEMMFPQARIMSLADGREFLEVFAGTTAWDLIVLDLMLPDLSGAEICRRVRGSERGARVPVLAMTGYDTPDMEKKIRDAGASDYLAKPFEMNEFRERIHQLVDKK